MTYHKSIVNRCRNVICLYHLSFCLDVALTKNTAWMTISKYLSSLFHGFKNNSGNSNNCTIVKKFSLQVFWWLYYSRGNHVTKNTDGESVKINSLKFIYISLLLVSCLGLSSRELLRADDELLRKTLNFRSLLCPAGTCVQLWRGIRGWSRLRRTMSLLRSTRKMRQRWSAQVSTGGTMSGSLVPVHDRHQVGGSW